MDRIDALTLGEIKDLKAELLGKIFCAILDICNKFQKENEIEISDATFTICRRGLELDEGDFVSNELKSDFCDINFRGEQ